MISNLILSNIQLKCGVKFYITMNKLKLYTIKLINNDYKS